jgi:hypothetical protein
MLPGFIAGATARQSFLRNGALIGAMAVVRDVADEWIWRAGFPRRGCGMN